MDICTVPTIAALKAINVSQYEAAYVNEPLKGGLFSWRGGQDFTAEQSADPLEAIYVKASSTPITEGAWVRYDVSEYSPNWWGAQPEPLTSTTVPPDSTAAFTAMASYIDTLTGADRPAFIRICGWYTISILVTFNTGQFTMKGNNWSTDGIFCSDCDGIHLNAQSGHKDVVFEGFGLATNQNGTRTGLKLTFSDGGRQKSFVRNLMICGLDQINGSGMPQLFDWGYGIYLDNVRYCRLQLNRVQGAADHGKDPNVNPAGGWPVDNCGVYMLNCNNIICESNDISSVRTGIVYRSYDPTEMPDANAEGFWARGNTIFDVKKGIYHNHEGAGACSDHYICGNHIGCEVGAIEINGTGNKPNAYFISDNFVFAGGLGSDFNVILLNCGDISIYSNTILGKNIDAVNGRAVTFTGPGVATRVFGNVIQNVPTPFYGDENFSGAAYVYDNMIRDHSSHSNLEAIKLHPDAEGTITPFRNMGSRQDDTLGYLYGDDIRLKDNLSDIFCRNPETPVTRFRNVNINAVNYTELVNSALNQAVELRAQGADSRIDMMLRVKGSNGSLLINNVRDYGTAPAANADASLSIGSIYTIGNQLCYKR